MSSSRPTPVWLGLLLLALAPCAHAASFTNATPSLGSDLPSLGYSVMRLLGSLVLVLAIFLGGVWAFRNWQRLALQRGRPSRLRILEMKSLGNRQALFLVACDQQRMLLGSSPAGVQLVAHLPEADPEAPQIAQPAFAQNLQQALTPKS